MFIFPVYFSPVTVFLAHSSLSTVYDLNRVHGVEPAESFCVSAAFIIVVFPFFYSLIELFNLRFVELCYVILTQKAC